MPRRNNNLQTISFNPVTFEGAGFNPVVYEPKEPDLSILERSLARKEERQEKANTKRDAVRETLGKLKSQMHQDAETEQYITNLENQINNNIEGAASMGDWAGALSIAGDEAGKLVSNKDVINRIKTNNQYEEEVKIQKSRVGKDIGQETYDWWYANNPYTYKDSNTEWNPNFRPVNDVDWASQAMAAFKMISPDKSRVGRSSSTSRSDDNGGSSSSSSSDQKYEKVNAADIKAVMTEFLERNPDTRRQIEQDYKVKRWKLEQMKEELKTLPDGSQEKKDLAYAINEREKFLNNGLTELSNDQSGLEIYAQRQIQQSLYADKLAYDWKEDVTASSSGSHTGSGGGGGGRGRGGNYIESPATDNHQNPQDNARSSSTVEKGNGVKAAERAKQAADNIRNRQSKHAKK